MGKKTSDDQILQISKEIVVKFIETGRMSTNTFPDAFELIYKSIRSTVKAEESCEKKITTTKD